MTDRPTNWDLANTPRSTCAVSAYPSPLPTHHQPLGKTNFPMITRASHACPPMCPMPQLKPLLNKRVEHAGILRMI